MYSVGRMVQADIHFDSVNANGQDKLFHDTLLIAKNVFDWGAMTRFG